MGRTSKVPSLTLGEPDQLDASTEDYCIIPEFEIYAGGPGRDALPALTNPRLLEAETVDYLDDDELVVGLRIDADSVAFPLRVLWYHEIVNFDLRGRSLAVAAPAELTSPASRFRDPTRTAAAPCR